MKKILVTGATGFIGRHVIAHLLHTGNKIVASSTSVERARQMPWFDRVEFIPLDLGSLEAGKDYFEFFGRPDLLIHLAWSGLPNYKSPIHLDINLPLQSAFLDNLIRHGLKDLTVTGTCFEYGMREGMLSEDMDVNPTNPYG
ncbi:MAG TPA: NAD(P)-dependent oxidoreductase, partial [Puia sp.]|nr:NAD(P)-dependent oxidoreductase [Puia sp.]